MADDTLIPSLFKKRTPEEMKPGGVYRSDIFMSGDEKRRRDAARNDAATEAEIRNQSRAASEERPMLHSLRRFEKEVSREPIGPAPRSSGGYGGSIQGPQDSEVLLDKLDQKRKLGY